MVHSCENRNVMLRQSQKHRGPVPDTQADFELVRQYLLYSYLQKGSCQEEGNEGGCWMCIATL